MSEAINPPIQIPVGFGRINATWIDGDAIWLADYYPHPEPDIEVIQLARRKKNLTDAFIGYKLLSPTIEILNGAAFDVGPEVQHDETDVGGQLLKVSTLLMPYVDPRYIRPIIELRIAPPTEQQVNESMVIRGLRAGGQAIENYFGSAMVARDPSQQR